jgi:hypothetical protein
MELSALLSGQGAAGDALEALTSRSESGQLLFTAPFGDSTVWSSRASGGTVRLACLFDPTQRWLECAHLSSTVGSDAWAEELRRKTGLLLCPDDMVSHKLPSKRELVWTKLRETLGDRAFAEYLSRDGGGHLAELVAIIERQVGEELNEDQALIEALGTRAFRITYHIALDSYPKEVVSEVAGRKSGDKKDRECGPASARDKLGVLVLQLTGQPSVPVGEACSGAHKAPPAPRVPSTVKQEQRDLDALLTRLELTDEDLAASHNEWSKELPNSAAEFFEQVKRYFNTLLARRQALLDQEAAKQLAMYR